MERKKLPHPYFRASGHSSGRCGIYELRPMRRSRVGLFGGNRGDLPYALCLVFTQFSMARDREIAWVGIGLLFSSQLKKLS